MRAFVEEGQVFIEASQVCIDSGVYIPWCLSAMFPCNFLYKFDFSDANIAKARFSFNK